jgi:hypothetical protein
VATEICRQWRDQREHDEEFSRRLTVFHGDGWRLSPSDPTVAAATYPPGGRADAAPDLAPLAVAGPR